MGWNEEIVFLRDNHSSHVPGRPQRERSSSAGLKMYTSVELKGVWGDRSLEMMAFLVPGACALPRGYRRLPAEADRGGGGEVGYRPDVLRGGMQARGRRPGALGRGNNTHMWT